MKNDVFKVLAEELVPYLMPYFENKLKDELSSISRQSDDNSLLTKKQVMSKLQISAMTLWRMEKDGVLVSVRLGGKVMYRLDDINKTFK